MYTTFFTQSVDSIDETYVVMSASLNTSSYFVRPHGFGTDWRRLRVGVRFTLEQAMGGSLSPNYGYAMQIGVCHGSTATGSYIFSTDNAYFCDLVPSTPSYTAAAGANMAFWAMGGNTISIKLTKGKSWYSVANGASIYAPANYAAATHRILYVDIISGSPFKFDFFFPSSPTAAPHVSKGTFYDIFTMISSSVFTNHSSSRGLGGTINGPTLAGTPMTMSHGEGELDSVFVALGAASKGPRWFVSDFAAWKMA